LIAVLAFVLIIAAVLIVLPVFFRKHTPKALDQVTTVAGSAGSYTAQPFGEVFGVAVSPQGVIYATDGVNGVVWEIAAGSAVRPLAEHLATPSGIAWAPDGTLVVADSGAHTILCIDPATGTVTVVAGKPNESGFADGDAVSARFNAPVGVAVGADGTIFVADTYNDRIRAIDKNGSVRTLAGGNTPGFADSPNGADARFDTPGGIAVAPDGTVIVADTDNHRIRRVTLEGAVTTVAGSGAYGSRDGLLSEATFAEPIGVAVAAAGSIYVADAAGDSVRVCQTGIAPIVVTEGGNHGDGLVDGPAAESKLNRPSGLGLAPNGTVIVADTGNRLVRAIVSPDRPWGGNLSPAEARTLRPTATEFRAAAPGRWPYEPSDKPRELAATFGEIRGEISPKADPAHFHNGLDIPGAYGEIARAVRSEKVLQLDSVGDPGGIREWLRLATMGYVHVRIGRDRADTPIAPERFQIGKSADGTVRVRVRRGTVINAGDPIGTLNNQNHVHLIAGPPGFEMNALAALDLPGVRDSKPPVIEDKGIHLFDESWKEVGGDTAAGVKQPIEIGGKVRITVNAYDQMDLNADRRRLGVFAPGYGVTPVGGSFPADALATTITFAELPEQPDGPKLIYGPGSMSGAHPPTVFGYIVTDHLAERRVSEDFFDTTKLSPGDYVIRVFAKDYFGNQTTRDITVRVVTR
jgi:sugar lactone lactonase YvrE